MHGDPIRQGQVYVAPPGFHLTLEPDHMEVTSAAREHGSRPAIDPLFRSAALAFGPRVIGVVLSGLLHDGTVGLRDVKRAGGLAMVQDPADTPWPSMPLNALAHVVVDHCASPARIGDLLVQIVVPDGEPASAPGHHADVSARELRALTMSQD